MTNKFYIAGVSDSPSTLIFGGPNLVPMPIPNPLWQGVLTDYVNAMNNPDEDAKLKTLSKFSRAQWKLIRQALSNTEPHPELDEAIKKAGY